MGLGFLFKLEDDSIARHKDERRVKGMDEEEHIEDSKEEVEVEILDESDGKLKRYDCVINIFVLILFCLWIVLLEDENKEQQPEKNNIQSEIQDEEVLSNIQEENEEEDDEDDKSDGDSDDDGKPHFPDTQIKIEHFAGTKYVLKKLFRIKMIYLL